MSVLAQSLTKRYGTAPGYEAVRDADLELRPGEFVSIVGRSGSGKSTLLAMLGALTRPTEGKVLFNGADIWALSEAELATFRCRHIGFVFQFPSLLSSLTAVDNVAVPALLGRTMDAEDAYARAYDLLDRVSLIDHADAYPDSMSGGEQRRLVIARALINSPPLLLADEPTSDLDEDTEADIIDLIERLQRDTSFGLILVTHNLGLAKRAHRTFEMRQGVLTATDLPAVATAAEGRPRHFVPAKSCVNSDVPVLPMVRRPVHLGRDLWRGVRNLLLAGTAISAGILLADLGISKYQEIQIRQRSARLAALEELALDSLRGEVKSVADLGDGRYELVISLSNVGGEQPIYVMSPDMRAYVQVGKVWQELSMKPADESARGVLKIDGQQTYRYLFDARVRDFSQLLPNYMHVRFSDTMLVSPDSVPKGDVFERKDNYYVYLKPFDVADQVILRQLRFPGKPPVWIPMPPH